MFTRADFARLAEQLAGIKGKFLMSLNDNDGVRQCFASFHMAPIATTYTIGTKTKLAGELLISNYALPANDA